LKNWNLQMNKRQRVQRAKVAGRAISERKSEAARQNGKKGGRPSNTKIAAYIAAQGCSRSTAYRKIG
jgi:hypothetical protein